MQGNILQLVNHFVRHACLENMCCLLLVIIVQPVMEGKEYLQVQKQVARLVVVVHLDHMEGKMCYTRRNGYRHLCTNLLQIKVITPVYLETFIF